MTETLAMFQRRLDRELKAEGEFNRKYFATIGSKRSLERKIQPRARKGTRSLTSGQPASARRGRRPGGATMGGKK